MDGSSERGAYLKDVKAALEGVLAHTHELAPWHQLGRLIDGRSVNYEEHLASFDELRGLDVQQVVQWDRYIWQQIHTLFPGDLFAVKRVAEYYAQVLDEPAQARPYVAMILAEDAADPDGLRWAVELALSDENEPEARSRLQALIDVDPWAPVSWGLLDFFEDWRFLRPSAARLVAAIETRWAQGHDERGYEIKLHGRLVELRDSPTEAS